MFKISLFCFCFDFLYFIARYYEEKIIKQQQQQQLQNEKKMKMKMKTTTT